MLMGYIYIVKCYLSVYRSQAEAWEQGRTMKSIKELLRNFGLHDDGVTPKMPVVANKMSKHGSSNNHSKKANKKRRKLAQASRRINRKRR